MVLGLAAAGFSFVAAAERDRLAEYASTVRPAKATLRKTEVREWIAGRGNWTAFGTFDVVAGDFRGSAEGDLAPRHVRRRSTRRRGPTPRAEAETFPAAWQVGRTYDGFWPSGYPGTVFWEPVPVAESARLVTQLRVFAPVLFVMGFLLHERARRSRP
jgi:hypothetical protein